MPMKANEREYRDFHLAPIEVRTEDNEEKKMIVRGYASTFNDPYVLYSDDKYEIWEQIDAKAFDEADMSDVILQYDHEGRVFARISNGTLKIDTDETGLAIEADLGGTDIGRSLYQEIEGGYTSKMSFGFTVAEEKWEETKNNETGKTLETRTITRVKKVYDVSAVSLPANDGTSISVRNLSEGVIEQVKAERLKALELKRKQTLTRMRTMKLGGN